MRGGMRGCVWKARYMYALCFQSHDRSRRTGMTDWKQAFETLKNIRPVQSGAEGETNFWENLYQAFRARYSHEQDEALRELIRQNGTRKEPPHG